MRNICCANAPKSVKNVRRNAAGTNSIIVSNARKLAANVPKRVKRLYKQQASLQIQENLSGLFF